MRVDVNVTKDDFLAFSRAVLKPERSRSSRVRRLLLLAVLWVAVVAGLSVLFSVTEFRLNLDLRTSAVTLLIFVGLFYFFLRRFQKRALPTDSGTVLGQHSYEFNDTGIQESSEHTQILIRWSGVRELRETDGHLFIMVDQNAGCIIPKRDLTSPEAEQALRSTVASRIDSAV